MGTAAQTEWCPSNVAILPYDRTWSRQINRQSDGNADGERNPLQLSAGFVAASAIVSFGLLCLDNEIPSVL
jgi:hypothetical protein